MSNKALPREVSEKIEIARLMVLALDFSLDEIERYALFVKDPNGLIYGVNFGTNDEYIAINFAMTTECPVNNDIRVAVLSEVASNHKIIKAYYEGSAFVLSSEAFVKTESEFLEFFKYSVSAIQDVYSKIEKQYPEGL